MKYSFNYLGRILPVKLEIKGEEISINADGSTHRVENIQQQKNCISLCINGSYCNAYFARSGDVIYMVINGNCYTLELRSDSSVKSSGFAAPKTDSVSSPMPGLIVKIPVTEGEWVKSGDTLVIVEAMKMQNELRAPRDGTVGKVNFKEGQQVDALQPIVELRPEEN